MEAAARTDARTQQHGTPPRGGNMADSAGTEGAGRVADVLLAFLEGPNSLGVSALSRDLGLSKAVVHRILQTLVRRGLLEADSGTREYRLGPSAAALGARGLRGLDLRVAAMPVLRELQRATGETTTVSAHVPGGRVYLDQVESVREIKMTVELGRRFPLHAGSSSTCILAFLPDEDIAAVMAGPRDLLTRRTIVDTTGLRQRIRDVRSHGFACSDGERQEGAGSVAAPVFGVDGQVKGAISVCGPAARVDSAARERFVPLLTSAADRISRELGWAGGLPRMEGRAIA
jgi:IclR family acetate operon transcriptional repressor